MTAYAYSCSEFPGMEGCPGRVQAQSEAELWKLIEVHAQLAHGEDVNQWSQEDRDQVQALIHTVE